MSDRIRTSLFVVALLVLTAACVGGAIGTSAAAPPIERIELPPGFRIELYAHPVENARSMALGPKGVLFVGTRRAGKVWVVFDDDGDHKADRTVLIARDLNMPNGVAFRDGDLYVAEVDRVLRYAGILESVDAPPEPTVFLGGLPKDRHHGWKFIRFREDGSLFVPVGAPCNVCDEEDERYASILEVPPEGGETSVYAHGVRNTVGFDWHPETGELWFTDNGRDWLGDDSPPDELNRATKKGEHFGFPHCHAGDVPDPDHGAAARCDSFVPPVRKLGPHVAALGVRFYTGDMFPPEYRGQAFIAEHGSWNRSEKIGYRVTLVRNDGKSASSYETFASGWLDGDDAWGRPVDVEWLPDGSMLVSDDAAGAIYRIVYEKKRESTEKGAAAEGTR